jgi:hypothetical protein
MTFVPLQFYVLTSGTTGDGMLPVRCQEHAVELPYPLVYGVICEKNLYS